MTYGYVKLGSTMELPGYQTLFTRSAELFSATFLQSNHFKQVNKYSLYTHTVL